MTSEAVYNFIYDWVNWVVNDVDPYPVPAPAPGDPEPEEPEPDPTAVPIIQSHQQSPAPDSQYLVINYAGQRARFGRAHRTEPEEDEETNIATVGIISDYILTYEIREINGTGNILQTILDSIERDDVQEFFKYSRVSFLNNENIQTLPRLDGAEWHREAILEFRLGVVTLVNETVELIETVVYTADIE